MKDLVDPKQFGERVRELRTEQRLSQTDLGRLADFSQTNIGWIEQGKAKDPKKQAIKLAEALQSSPDWLLYGTGQRTTGLRALTPEQFAKVYSDLPRGVQQMLTQMVREHADDLKAPPQPTRKAR